MLFSSFPFMPATFLSFFDGILFFIWLLEDCLRLGSPHRMLCGISCQLLDHVHQVHSFCYHFGGVAPVGESATFTDDRISVVVDVYDENQVTIVVVPVVFEGWHEKGIIVGIWLDEWDQHGVLELVEVGHLWIVGGYLILKFVSLAGLVVHSHSQWWKMVTSK